MSKRRKLDPTEPIFVIQINSDISNEILEKLFSNIRYNTINECWIRGNDSTIYTTINVNGKPKRASRIMYELVHGKPPDHFACHKCDTPACINPEHIYDGTITQNNYDSAKRSYELSIYQSLELKRAKKFAKKQAAEVRRKL